MNKDCQAFHIVDLSPWPLVVSLGAMNVMSSFLVWLGGLGDKFSFLLLINILLILVSLFAWWRDVSRESFLQGMHTIKVTKGLKLGMLTFIVSEVMFFISFFWCFFHMSLSPESEIGVSWAPISVMVFDPYQVPLLNTMILLSSGVSVTWSHFSILKKNHTQYMFSMVLTIYLGFIFLFFQKIEYSMSMFCINDSVYGSIFFFVTGFHGLHVMIGMVFLIVNLLRGWFCEFNSFHHLGLELSIWYWHFVDVVWLYLFIFVYWWYF